MKNENAQVQEAILGGLAQRPHGESTGSWSKEVGASLLVSLRGNWKVGKWRASMTLRHAHWLVLQQHIGMSCVLWSRGWVGSAAMHSL